MKTGTDPGAAAVNLTRPIDTTVAQLRALTPPADIHHFVGRVAGVEDRDWIVDATLTLFKTEGDSDYHLVMREGGVTMIAEIPDPGCVDSSPWRDQIAAVRAAFEQQFNGVKAKKNLRVHVRVTGIGFFDFIHGQTGVAPNGIEIHPVLGIEFVP